MKRVRFIINPSSGRQSFETKVNNVAIRLLNRGYTVSKYFTQKKDDAREETKRCCTSDYDIIIACGGDGTINEVASGIAESEEKLPVAIIAAGTVNDFANFLEYPSDADAFCDIIENFNILDVDLGHFDNKYFVNVAAMGLMANVAHEVTSEMKSMLGSFAYYIEGLRQLPMQNQEPIKVKIESDEYTSEEEILLVLIANSSSIGGFRLAAPTAEIHDGLLDCVIIRNGDLSDIISIFMMILNGEHVNHKKVHYFKTKQIKITSEQNLAIDIDGEYAGQIPAEFKILPKAFRVFVK